MVRAGPIDLPASRATAEVVVIPAGQRLKAVNHLVLRNGGQCAVAPHAAGKRRKPLAKVQSPQDLERLLLGVLRADEEAVGESATLQQGTISGQQDPLLGQADVNQRLVLGVTGPPHVKAKEAKQTRQPTEVHVDDEARITQRHRAQPGRRPDVERLEHRVCGDAVAGRRAVAEILGIAVEEDEVDLGVRNAQRFQNVLDGLVRAERSAQRLTARLGCQEVVEFGVCPDCHITGYTPPRLSCGQTISGTRRCATANSKSHCSSISAFASWLPVALILSNASLLRSIASALSKVAAATPRPDARSTSRLALQNPSSSSRAGRRVIL